MAWAKIDSFVLRDNTCFSDDFTGACPDWQQTGDQVSVNTTNDNVDFDWIRDGCSHAISHNLGSAQSQCFWTLRFKFNPVSSTNPDSSRLAGFIGLFSADHSVDVTTAQDYIEIMFRGESGGLHDIRIAEGDNANPSASSCATFTTVWADGTPLYVEIKRTSVTAYEASLFSDANYSVLLEKETGTTQAATAGLQYIKIISDDLANVNGTWTGTIDDVKFYNGNPSNPNSSITVVNTLKATLLCDTFTCDNWNDTGTQNQVNTCTEVLDWDFIENACNQATSFDLGCGVVSCSQWVLRWKHTVDALTNPSSGANMGWMGLSDKAHCEVSSSSGNQNFITFRNHRQNDSESQIRISANTGTTQCGGGHNAIFAHGNLVETIWYELRRTSTTSYTARLYSCACYNELIEQESATISACITGLRYVKWNNRSLAPDGGTHNGTSDDIRFYNGTQTPYNSMGKHIKFTANTIHCGNARPSIIFNDCAAGVCNTSGNYAYRENLNNTETSVTTTDDKTQIALWGTEANPHLIEAELSNIACEAKLTIAHHTNRGTAGAAAAPNRGEVVGKWDITNECIGKITIINDGGSGTFDLNSSITVWATC